MALSSARLMYCYFHMRTLRIQYLLFLTLVLNSDLKREKRYTTLIMILRSGKSNRTQLYHDVT